MHHTLTALDLPRDRVLVHMLAKSTSVFHDSERERMEAYGATRIIVMDQGSRGGPPLVSPTTKTGDAVRTLVIDHHESDAFPEGALAVSACRSPPIATSSLLTYLLCLPLHPSVSDACAIPALLGVFGDLGPSAVNWNEKPWPSHLGDVVKKVTKKALTDAVSMMNAPRRTAEYQGCIRRIYVLRIAHRICNSVRCMGGYPEGNYASGDFVEYSLPRRPSTRQHGSRAVHACSTAIL